LSKSRLEAFSDGVIAIIITIMVLELRPPESTELAALRSLAPVLASYVMSFVFLGIYWSNHHHLLQVVTRVNGATLWANLHLLFWLTLVPFVTSWMGQSHFAAGPLAAYGVVLICAAVAYTILVRVLLAQHPEDSLLARAIGADVKGKISLVLYAAAIALAFVSQWASGALYALVALMWLVPDRRIERVLTEAK
jgi:uncharacterized membrane protein